MFCMQFRYINYIIFLLMLQSENNFKLRTLFTNSSEDWKQKLGVFVVATSIFFLAILKTDSLDLATVSDNKQM